MIYILILALSVQPPDFNQLIDQLGDLEYSERESAAGYLYKLSPESIPYLKKATNHKDPEIKYMSRYLLRKIREVYPSDRFGVSVEIPSIWNLSNRERFKNGKDVALKYYNKVYLLAYKDTKELDIVPDWQQRQWVEDKKKQEYLSELIRIYTGLDIFPFKYEYRLGLAEIRATVAYIGDRREQGLSYEDAVKVLDQMVWNGENMCRWGQKYNSIPLPLYPKSFVETIEKWKEIYRKMKTKAYENINVFLFEKLINGIYIP